MAEDGRSAYAQLLKPIVIRGEPYGFVAIQARLVGWSLRAVFDGIEVSANFMFRSRIEDADLPFAPGPNAGIGSILLHASANGA